MTRVSALKMAESFPKHTLCVLSKEHGHEEFSWDPSDSGSVAIAEREFAAAKGQGMTGIHIDENGVGEAISTFDPDTHERVVMTPQIQGG